jgi:galactose mutarotase-like enzyme
MIVEGGLKLNEQLFERDAIVIKSPSFDQLTLIDEANLALLTVQSDNWEAIGIWTKKGAPFLCIEPWWGFADSKNTSGNLFQKDGIHILEPGQTETVSYSILVHE